MRLNLRQVEAFHAVMRTGSMTGAADLMAITQPAVTRLIRDFEEAVSFALFERRGNQLLPTAGATALVAEVDRSFIGLERIARLAVGIRQHTAGSLRIAAMPAVANTLLPMFLASFLATRPQLQVTLLGVPSHLVAEMIAAGQADIGYAEGPLDRHGLDIKSVPLASVVVLPEGHPLTAHSVLKPEDLANEQFIGLASGSLFSAGVDLAFAEVPRTIRIETGLSYTACALVARGLGVCVVDPNTARDFVGRGLEVRPLSVHIDTGFLVIRSKTQRGGGLIDLFSSEFLAYNAGLVERLAKGL